jgi:hypothetical protein
MKKVSADKIYEKWVDGDSLSNAELKYGIEFYEELSRKLSACGPAFRLAFKEANQVYLGLCDYQDARKR